MAAPEQPAQRPPGAEPPGRRRVRRILHLTLIAVVALCVTAVAVVVIARDTTSSDDQATPPPAPPLSVPAPTAPAAGLPPAHGPRIAPSALRGMLRPLLSSKRLGREVGYAFATLSGRHPLLTSGRHHLVTPASTLKLLTAAAALRNLGPAHRFDTRVVRVRGTHRIVLVGGGDPLLTDVNAKDGDAFDDYPKPASLEDLAAATARALGSAGIHRVDLAFDDSLFTGPAVNPHWEPFYVPESIVSPISALWVNEGREKVGLAPRVRDAGLAAARRFAALLRGDGLDVRRGVDQKTAPPRTTPIAEVQSPPLAQIVEHTLELSDNEAAEVLLRQAAIASGRPGSFAGGVAALRDAMRSLGVGLAGARIYDGSGLSRGDRLPIWALVQVLQAAARPGEPSLRPLLTSLPVAGFTGSLVYRFIEDAPRGLGVVRAKTGTLTGVHGLAGIAMTADGEPMLFAVVADEVPVRRTLAARAQLDRIAAAVTTCC